MDDKDSRSHHHVGPTAFWVAEDGQPDDPTFCLEEWVDVPALTGQWHSQDNGAGNSEVFSPQEVRQNYTSAHGESAHAKRFACEKCNHPFGSAKDLKRHKKSKHRTDSSPVFKCRCGKTDPRKDNHKRHVMKCGGDPQYGSLYTCICGTRYANFGEYLGKDVICTVCPFTAAGCVVLYGIEVPMLANHTRYAEELRRQSTTGTERVGTDFGSQQPDPDKT
ncbi:hypothetical protein F4680DRAFT_470182 [Xylaria scruposa]|nr:hypothetical protein F4680DRAFT_470182 [Xylaria scruposa]